MDLSKYDEYIIKFDDWSSFQETVEKAVEKGFSTDEEFVNLIGFDFNLYTKIRENAIYNWIDSISKSLIHSINNITDEFPTKGTPIFKDLTDQTRILLVMGRGKQTSNMFGQVNSTIGLSMIPSEMLLTKIKNIDYNGSGKTEDRYLNTNGQYLLTTDRADIAEKVNNIIRYMWCYIFLQKLKIKDKKIKKPKFLYRGIRNDQLYKIFKDVKELEHPKHDKHYHNAANYIMLVKKYLVGKNVKDLLEGRFCSFTSSYDVAKYFANSRGIVIKVDTNDVDIVASELTEEIFKEPNSYTNKKEKEYIVDVKNSVIVDDSSIMIEHEDYYMSMLSPLYVNYISHDNILARYDYNNNGDVVHVEAYGYWQTDTKFVKRFRNKSDKGWGMSKKEFMDEFKFDPTPSENNLNLISNFRLYNVNNYSDRKEEISKLEI